MNFSPLTNLPGGMQLTTGKLQGAGLPQSQMLLGSESLHFMNAAQTQPQLITLPISVAGKNDSDPLTIPQTIQIQVVPGTSPATVNGAKFVMPIQFQGFPQGAATVFALAYNQPGPGEPLQLQLQPQMGQMPESNNNDSSESKIDSDADEGHDPQMVFKEEKPDSEEEEDINAEPEEADPQISWSPPSMQLSLQDFLRFSADTIRRENALGSTSPLSESNNDSSLPAEQENDPKLASKKRKRNPRKKAPRPKKPRPGQVHIATALDGTTLYCCPECHMAYPDKELLEQHLVGHKIERRFICDTCGAGLKRKEHLERHKLGHNPERPFICPVCSKGFKRKEHLNLHSVIHSGSKTEVCMECGKGFYRKDHLRKHAKSHMTKKMKEAAQAQAQTILEAQQLAQVQVDIPNMPGLSVIPITTSLDLPSLPIKTELVEEDEPDPDTSLETEADIEEEAGDMPMDDDDFLSSDGLPDVSGSSPLR